MYTPRVLRSQTAASRANSIAPSIVPSQPPETPARSTRGNRANLLPETPAQAPNTNTNTSYGSAGPVNPQGQVNTDTAVLQGIVSNPDAGESDAVDTATNAEPVHTIGRFRRATTAPRVRDNAVDRNQAAAGSGLSAIGRARSMQPRRRDQAATGRGQDAIASARSVQARHIDNHYTDTEIRSSFSYIAPQRIMAQTASAGRRLSVTMRRNAGLLRGMAGLVSLMALCIGLFYVWPLVPALPNFNITGYFHNFVDSITENAERARNASINGTIFDPNLYSRLQRVETDISELRIQWADFKDRLPDEVAVAKDPESGEMIVPDGFYKAFLSRLQHEEVFKSGDDKTWEDFINDNDERINSIVSSAAKSHVQGLHDSGVIVSQAAFVSALDQHAERLFDFVKQRLKSHQQTYDYRASHRASAVASAVASQVVAQRPPSAAKYIEDLTLLTLAHNMDTQRQRNYLNINVGATVDHVLTSPTYFVRQPNVFARAFVMLGLSKGSLPNPPETAISPWNEAGECWCAATSHPDPGKAQLAVILPRPVRPRALIIEHVPSVGTWDVNAAPREIEVWGLRTAVGPHEYKAPTAKEAVCGEYPNPAPDGNWICLGTAIYDVHGPNNIQTFPLHAPHWPDVVKDNAPKTPESYMFDAVIIRVTKNWGHDWTCLYRVRLLGEGKEEIQAEYATGTRVA